MVVIVAMATLIKPDQRHGSLKDVEHWLRKEKNVKLAQKLNAIRLLMKGRAQKEVADVLGVTVTTVRNWRTRWNREGKEGLKAKHKGSRSRITEDIRLDIKDVIEVKKEIDGRTVTGVLIHGRIKKNTT